MTEPNTRSRTLTYLDPQISAKMSRSVSGIEYLRGMIDDLYPPAPMALWCNMRLLEVETGRVIFTAQAGEEHYNPLGVVHGGFACTVLDTALGCAVMSVTPLGSAYTTVQIDVQLVRGITVNTGLMRVAAQTLHVGRQIATADAKLTDTEGKLYAHATTTCIFFARDGG